MAYLYVLASEHRATYVARKAQCLIGLTGDRHVIVMSETDRLNQLFALINTGTQYIDRACFAIDGRDQNAIADFNAFMYALRMHERLNDQYPVTVRSINLM